MMNPLNLLCFCFKLSVISGCTGQLGVAAFWFLGVSKYKITSIELQIRLLIDSWISSTLQGVNFSVPVKELVVGLKQIQCLQTLCWSCMLYYRIFEADTNISVDKDTGQSI